MGYTYKVAYFFRLKTFLLNFIVIKQICHALGGKEATNSVFFHHIMRN